MTQKMNLAFRYKFENNIFLDTKKKKKKTIKIKIFLDDDDY